MSAGVCDMVNQVLSKDVIVRLYMENVERFILIATRYLRSKEKAQDIVHECFEYIMEKKDVLTGNYAELKSYMYLMVRSRCLNEIRQDTARKENLKRLYSADMEFLSDDNVSRKMVECDFRKVMDMANMKVPKRAFDIYVSSKIGGMSHKELAKLYGVAQSRVAKDISKTNKIIQALLQSYLRLITFLMVFISFGS